MLYRGLASVLRAASSPRLLDFLRFGAITAKELAYGAPEIVWQRTVQGHAAPLTTQPHQPHSTSGRGARSEQREHDRCPSSTRQSRPASRSGPTS